MSIYSSNAANNYRGVVHAVSTLYTSPRDELVEAAVHAFNSVKKYVNKGYLRTQFKPNGVETIVVVTKTDVIMLPAVETFLLFTQVDVAIRFLANLAGMATVANRFPEEENPF